MLDHSEFSRNSTTFNETFITFFTTFGKTETKSDFLYAAMREIQGIKFVVFRKKEKQEEKKLNQWGSFRMEIESRFLPNLELNRVCFEGTNFVSMGLQGGGRGSLPPPWRLFW